MGWGWLELSADPASEFSAVRGRRSVQGEEMLAFSHFGGLDAPASQLWRPPNPGVLHEVREEGREQ